MVRTRNQAKLDSPSNGHTTSAEKRPIEAESEDKHAVKRPKLEGRTDYSRWRMLDEGGRQTWHYLEDDAAVEKWPQTTADKYFLGRDLVCADSVLSPVHC